MTKNVNWIHDIYKILRDNSSRWPETSLAAYKRNPFKSLIVAIISTQTREENTIFSAKKIFQLGETPEDIVKLSVQQIREAISSSSFYNHKTEYIRAVCLKIIQNEGKVPEDINDLMKYPGVGYKVAVLTLANGYGYSNDICIDTHVTRVGKRLGLIKPDTNNPQHVSAELRTILPPAYWYEWNGYMVKFGREVCKPRKPQCNVCPLEHICPKLNLT